VRVETVCIRFLLLRRAVNQTEPIRHCTSSYRVIYSGERGETFPSTCHHAISYWRRHALFDWIVPTAPSFPAAMDGVC
jgi:hypothetical protein